MNLLRVFASMDPAFGGPCQGIRNSIPALEKLGVHNEVVSFDDPAAHFLGKDSFLIHALGSGKGPWSYSPVLIPWLLQNLERFDAVIVHGNWLYYGYAVRKAIRILKKQSINNTQKETNIPQVFIMPHGMLDPYFQRATGRKFKALRNWAYWKLIEGKVVNEANGVLFTCEEELFLARVPFRPYRPKREINVGYGIAEPPPYNPAMRNVFLERCPELKGRPYFLFLSRIHTKKGVDLLIEAYIKVFGQKLNEIQEAKAELDSQPSNADLSADIPALVIAGPGLETSYGQNIQQLALKLKSFPSSIYFTGMLTGDAKWGALYGCDAFILPSHQENFGIAVVEALACGKPVLISNQVNIWREIESAGGGIVANDTLEGVRELLQHWMHLPNADKLSMRQKAQESYKSNFSIGPAAYRLLNAIKN